MSESTANVNFVPQGSSINELETKFNMQQQVLDYLSNTPDFFIDHPSILSKLNIPHSQKGSVSLVEIQSEQLRNQVKSLSAQLKQLIDIAKDNQQIYEVFAELNLRILQSNTIEDVRSLLSDVLTTKLALNSAKIHLFAGENAVSEIQQRLFKDKRFSHTKYFFGRLSENEKQLLFGDARAESSALILLGEDTDLGILAIGSADASHFSPDMDTLLINQLRTFLNTVIPDLMR